ncbi:hypothetical protein PflA506_1456 [Pseudomonas fluorescens A506]|nr:hypothetical protein PflA506_1456 [Pseudomonas fluorescens A506]
MASSACVIPFPRRYFLIAFASTTVFSACSYFKQALHSKNPYLQTLCAIVFFAKNTMVCVESASGIRRPPCRLSGALHPIWLRIQGMADRDEDDKWLSYDGQKHETHFQANERDKAHGKEMRETFQKEVSLKGNLVQVIYLFVCVLVFAGAQGFESGLGYVLLLPMAWGLYALTKFVNKFSQEQRDRIFMWTLIAIAVISITMMIKGIVK